MNSFTYYFGVLLLFMAITYFVLAAAGFFREKRWKVVSRLQTIKDASGGMEGIEPLSMPFQDRIILPFLKKIGETAVGLTPSKLHTRLSERLMAAGYMDRSGVANFLILQVLLLLIIPVLTIMLTLLATASLQKVLLYGFFSVPLAVLLPIVVLNHKKTARQNAIRKSLPDVLDLLVVSVEAGLGLDMALVKVTEKTRGPLTDELASVLKEIRIGKMRRMALKDMAERTGVEELISFVSAIIQADQLGVGIGNVLRVQSDAIRTYRRQYIEEAAAKAPIKMLFPLIFCIFPAMFAVVLGPAILQLIRIFATL